VSCGSSVQPETSIPPKNQWKVSYLIFGVFCGESYDDVRAHIYRVDDLALVQDTTDGIFAYPVVFKFTRNIADTSKYRMAQNLITKIPDELSNGTRGMTVLHDTVHRTFGCPDCGDQYGFFAEFKYNDTTRRFWIDTDTTYLPQYLLTFAHSMDSVIWEIMK
jgi:hypothetical protein